MEEFIHIITHQLGIYYIVPHTDLIVIYIPLIHLALTTPCEVNVITLILHEAE